MHFSLKTALDRSGLVLAQDSWKALKQGLATLRIARSYLEQHGALASDSVDFFDIHKIS